MLYFILFDQLAVEGKQNVDTSFSEIFSEYSLTRKCSDSSTFAKDFCVLFLTVCRIVNKKFFKNSTKI